MNFFVDRCISARIAHMTEVYESGIHVIRHFDDDKRFIRTTPDEDWMIALAADDPPWIVLTADIGISRNKAEREILRSIQLKFFFLARQWSKMQLPDQVWKFFRVWPNLVRIARTEEGRLFEISGSTNLKISRHI